MPVGFDFNAIFSEGLAYFQQQLLSNIWQGDPTSIAVAGILAIIALAIIFKITSFIYAFIKRIFIFLVIMFSLYFFVVSFQDKIFAPQPDWVIVGIGIIGMIIGFIALITSIFSVGSTARRGYSEWKAPGAEEEGDVEPEEGFPVKKYAERGAFNVDDLFLHRGFADSIKEDRSLLAVLSYVVIAEFGVFSSVTLAAPDPYVGMAFFVLFLIAAFVFIKTSYRHYSVGVRHLLVATVVAVIVSIILGHYWNQIAFETLFSVNYFSSPAVVAVVTAIAVSLFVGSKG